MNPPSLAIAYNPKSAPSTPSLLSPTNGATGVSLTVTLDWDSVSTSESYRLQVAKNPYFNSPMTRVITISEYTAQSGELSNSTLYYWRARSENCAGNSPYSDYQSFTTGTSSVEQIVSEVPFSYTPIQNYPNPFNPSTTIKYALPHASHINLSVFNTLGQRVALLVDGKQDAGYHEVTFEGSGLTSGVYFYRLQARSTNSQQANDYIETKKLILMK